MKILMIGPVAPHKGGIAHYTSLMVQKLIEKHHDVIVVSYKLKKIKKNITDTVFNISNAPVYFLMQRRNSIEYFRTIQFIKKIQDIDMIIFQWESSATRLTQSINLLIFFQIIKKYGKLVFLCHDVLPHESSYMKILRARRLLKNGDGYIVHAKTEVDNLKKIIKDPVYVLTPHPVYSVFKFSNMSQAQARKILTLETHNKVILFFGHIKQYKGLIHLIKAMPFLVKNDQDFRLLIVGECIDRTKEEYVALLKEHQCVEQCKIYDGYIPDREVEKFFAACDVVVLPYESATQSGVVQIAYSFEKPVIVTDVGGLPDVVEDGKTGYIIPPCDPANIVQTVLKFFSQENKDIFTQHIRGIMHRFSWDRLEEAVRELHKKLNENPRL
jgi:glycosyltransferase involved in cell wall biosynthesis